ncbi:MAG: beta-lactamase family protein [Lentimicrobium sp.]|nr:beta-lactamase family protein [Lentimicrobium sp.]
MKILLRAVFILFFVAGFSAYDSRISSANFNENEILTENESLDIFKILSADKIFRLDSLINDFSIRTRFNGNILVALNGHNIFERSVGYADPITKSFSKPETIYQLASVSKQFTAAAIMLLKSDGRLSFDDLITKYLPELPYKDITIKHLLHHMGGLPNYMYLTDNYWKKETPPDNEDVVELMASHNLPVFFKPGSRYDYSNTGYVMLATIVQRITGLSLNEFLQRRIFSPLGMRSTYVFSTADSSMQKRHIDGFRALRSGYARIADTRNNGPVGDKGVCSTTGDMFKWDRALYTDFPIKHEILEEAFSESETNSGKIVPYGFGFRIRELNEGKVIYHNGLWEGARTNFHRYIQQQNTIIVLNNTSIRTNHELVRLIEATIGPAVDNNPTETIARLAMEEGAVSAHEFYDELQQEHPELRVNFRSIMEVAAYLHKVGKTNKASQLEEFCTEALKKEA